MARALIVGCGCCGRALGQRLLAEGWAVRGTSRGERGLEAIAAAGIEPALADPERPATLLELVGDVAVLVLALGSLTGDPEQQAAIHGPRLESLSARLVDTPVRGVVYEVPAAGGPAARGGGAEVLRGAEQTWRLPLALVEATREDPAAWVEAMADGVREAASPAGGRY